MYNIINFFYNTYYSSISEEIFFYLQKNILYNYILKNYNILSDIYINYLMNNKLIENIYFIEYIFILQLI